MRRGVHLSLLIGPVVPAPAPKVVMDALEEVVVTTKDVGRSGFQLTFTLSTRSPLHTLFLVLGGSPVPIVRVILVVTVAGAPNVLIDGVVTHHEVVPASEPGQATLSVTGEDLSVLMDRQDFSGLPYPAVPAEGRVALLIAKYAVLGLIPAVVPSVLVDVPIPTNLIPGHRGTDLAYINELARRVGYVFYLEAGPAPGSSVAYWGPQIKVGVPQPALNVDMDAHTNVESLSFSFDSESRGLPTVFLYDEVTKVPIPIPIPIPDITPLNPPLGLLPPIPTSLRPIPGVAKYSAPRAIMIGLAKAASSADAVKGSGSLDVARYGRLLRPRRLVGVRGAGPAFDGLHYVSSVTDRIRRGTYTQSFELRRNGLISTIPAVVA
jgi:hypothetical protein